MPVTYEGSKPMPTYRSDDGAQVQALKIKLVGELLGGVAMVPEDDSYGNVTADFRWVEEQKPAAGGYVVRDGADHWSFVPAPVFEAGYTPVAA